MSLSAPKLSEQGYEAASKLLSIFHPAKSSEANKTQSRVVGGTDYAKFDKMALEIEKEDILSREQILKMLNPNDVKIQRQMFEGSEKPKIEICQIYKNEGDYYLKLENYNLAKNSYEKAIEFLFFNVHDDENMKKIVEKYKVAINLNLSLCLMKANKYKDAVGYLLEAQRLQSNNLKIKYRLAHCYFMDYKYDESKKIISNVVSSDEYKKEEVKMFHDLMGEIDKKILEQNRKKGKMMKKIFGN